MMQLNISVSCTAMSSIYITYFNCKIMTEAFWGGGWGLPQYLTQ